MLIFVQLFLQVLKYLFLIDMYNYKFMFKLEDYVKTGKLSTVTTSVNLYESEIVIIKIKKLTFLQIINRVIHEILNFELFIDV